MLCVDLQLRSGLPFRPLHYCPACTLPMNSRANQIKERDKQLRIKIESRKMAGRFSNLLPYSLATSASFLKTATYSSC